MPLTGHPLELSDLSWPELTAARQRMMKALMKVSAQKNALEALGVGPSLAQEVEANLQLERAPATAALDVYTGVLFDALAHHDLTDQQRQVAQDCVVVISALWGAVRATDRITPYRLSGDTKLRGLGKVGSLKASTYWRPHLDAVLGPEAIQQVVVDCRSATYAAAFRPPAVNTVGITVVQEVKGRRVVVSHNAKHTRGLVARHLIEQTADGVHPHTIDEVVDVVRQRWDVEVAAPTTTKPGQLTVVVAPS